MGKINLKINLKILQSVHVNIDLLKVKILEELKKDGYEIVFSNGINIKFNDYGAPLFRVRGASSSKLREGNFTLIKEGDHTMLRLDFCIPFLTLLIVFVILFFLGFLWGWGVLFIIGLLIVGFTSEILQQKNNAKNLLIRIIE